MRGVAPLGSGTVLSVAGVLTDTLVVGNVADLLAGEVDSLPVGEVGSLLVGEVGSLLVGEVGTLLVGEVGSLLVGEVGALLVGEVGTLLVGEVGTLLVGEVLVGDVVLSVGLVTVPSFLLGAGNNGGGGLLGTGLAPDVAGGGSLRAGLVCCFKVGDSSEWWLRWS